MRAAVGDRIIVRGKTVETADRHGVITEVKGPDGKPPYAVTYDDGHQALVFPGGDFAIEHASAPEA